MTSPVLYERRHSGGFIVAEAPNGLSRDEVTLAQQTPPAAPSTPSLSATTGGSLASGTVYGKVTYVGAFGETEGSAEQSVSVSTNNEVVVTSPASVADATGWNFYAASASGAEVLQNTTPNAIGANYTMTALATSGVTPPTINPNNILPAGLVLGLAGVGAGIATSGGSDTGNGTFGTIASIADKTQVGTYNLDCIQATTGTAAATAHAAEGNTGTGTIGSVTVGSTAQLGDYRLVLTATGATAAFDVFYPDGALVGSGNVASAFSAGGLGFTLANAGTMTNGDAYNIIVTDNGVALFSVTDPAGNARPNLTVGTPYSDEFSATLSQGATKFAVSDTYAIAFAAGSGNYAPLNLAATDGTENAAAILFNETDASQGTVKVTVIDNQAQVNGGELIYPAAATVAQIATINAQLGALGIKVR